MKEINCNIIQDILPLYVDDVVSPDTKEIVEEHLETCESCRYIAEKMKQDVQIPAAKDTWDDEAEMFRQLKKKLNTRKIKVSILSVVLTLTIVIGGYWTMYLHTEYIPYNPEHIRVYEENGSVYAEYKDMDFHGLYGSEKEIIENGKAKNVWIFYSTESLWSKYIEPHLDKKHDRKWLIGTVDEFDAVYYGNFYMDKKDVQPKQEEDATKDIIKNTKPLWTKAE